MTAVDLGLVLVPDLVARTPAYVDDVLAAFEWLKAQPYVNPKKVALSGWSLGACVSLAAAEKNKEFCAVALFSPRIVEWNTNPNVQARLLHAAENLSIPVFVVNASDEPAADSTTAITRAVQKNNPIHRVETYQHTGYKAQQKTCLAINSIDTWGYDVLRFIQRSMPD